MPQVTVVIATFNYANLIGQTLDSLLEQTLTDWECVIVDDGSTDNTREVVSSYLADERFRYFLIPNSGPSASRNFGVKHATGRYIQFLDADDLLESRKLEIHCHFLNEHPSVSLVYGTAVPFVADSTARQLQEDNPYDSLACPSGSGADTILPLFKANITVISAPLFRASLLERLSREETFLPSLSGNEDWELWLRFALSGACFQFLDLPETRSLIRFHPNSWSRAGTRMLEDWALLHQLVAPDLKGTPFVKANRKGYYFATFNWASWLCEQRQWREVLRIVRQVRKYTHSWQFICLWFSWAVLKSSFFSEAWTRVKRLCSRS